MAFPWPAVAGAAFVWALLRPRKGAGAAPRNGGAEPPPEPVEPPPERETQTARESALAAIDFNHGRGMNACKTATLGPPQVAQQELQNARASALLEIQGGAPPLSVARSHNDIVSDIMSNFGCAGAGPRARIIRGLPHQRLALS